MKNPSECETLAEWQAECDKEQLAHWRKVYGPSVTIDDVLEARLEIKKAFERVKCGWGSNHDPVGGWEAYFERQKR